MKEDASALPTHSPGGAGNEDSIQLSPGNRVVAEAGGPRLAEPAASPEATIAQFRRRSACVWHPGGCTTAH